MQRKCECEGYEHLELLRKCIDRRIKETKKLRKQFEILAEHENRLDKLLRCEACGQYWQSSRAWNFGNKEYQFKVPEIEIAEWLSEPYVRPDQMLIHSAIMQDYFERNTFAETDNECRAEGCNLRAIKLSVFCTVHHIEALQRAGALPRDPKGRGFLPYHSAGASNDV